ncbi:unnamed protein product [Bathycoccus prasinos]
MISTEFISVSKPSKRRVLCHEPASSPLEKGVREEVRTPSSSVLAASRGVVEESVPEIVEGKRFKPAGAPRAVAIHAPGAGQRGLGLWDITTSLTEDSTLAERFALTRLETRTKESNMCASRWVSNPYEAQVTQLNNIDQP